MGKRFTTIQISAEPQAHEINRIQANISALSNAIDSNLSNLSAAQAALAKNTSLFSGGVILPGLSVANGSNTYTHNLGYVPSYWLIVDAFFPDALSIPVYCRTAWTKTTITITSDASGGTITLWVK